MKIILDSMVKKVRPIAEVKWDNGCDGRDGRYYIHYRCPTCKRSIAYFKSSTSCDECGTYYDWGEKEPSIVVTRDVKW